MDWEIARVIAYLAVATGSAFAIFRWPLPGFILSLFLGHAAIGVVFRIWPASGYDEDAEEWPVIGWIVMFLWCLALLILSLVRRELRKKRLA